MRENFLPEILTHHASHFIFLELPYLLLYRYYTPWLLQKPCKFSNQVQKKVLNDLRFTILDLRLD